jgi:hypothetical protein
MYIPLIPRLARLWADPTMANTMKDYRKRFLPFSENDVDQRSIRDFWDGQILKDYLLPKESGIFQNVTDVALQLSIDGVSMVTDRSNPHTTTPVLLQVLNLPPDLRFKRQHKLLCMLLPGPQEPKNLASWLRPLWRELHKLHQGVRALDGSLVRHRGDALEAPHELYNDHVFFSLRACVTLVVGDQVAMNALASFRGAGSKRSCRMCWFKGTRPPGSTIYYPVHQQDTDLLNLPMRNQMSRYAREICDLDSESARKEAGIKGLSFLLKLPSESAHYPFAIPYGPMHLFLLNIVRGLFFVWKGASPCDKTPPPGTAPEVWTRQQYVLSDRQWTDIGQELQDSKKQVPSALGRAPQNPSTQKLRASAWHTWFVLYSVPVLHGRLPDEYLEHWILLIRAYDLCLKWVIEEDDLDKIQSLLVQFVRDFKRLYVDCDDHPKRPRLYTTNIHGLLHVHDQLKDCGPMFAWDEASTETYMGTIQPMARSGVKIDESAANATFLEEMLKTLAYARPQLSIPFGRPGKLNPRAYETELGFLLPVVESLTVGDLTNLQRRRLQEYFTTLIGNRRRVSFPDDVEVKKWARYQIKDEWQGLRLSGHKIGSTISQRPGSITRASHWIRYQLIDSREDCPDLFYGQVEFFLSITIDDIVRQSSWKRGPDGKLIPERFSSSSRASSQVSHDREFSQDHDDSACEHYLAYVRNWHVNALDEETGNRRVKLVRNGPYEFIELRSVDCAVGKISTAQGDWIVSASVHPSRNPIDTSEDELSESEDDRLA